MGSLRVTVLLVYMLICLDQVLPRFNITSKCVHEPVCGVRLTYESVDSAKQTTNPNVKVNMINFVPQQNKKWRKDLYPLVCSVLRFSCLTAGAWMSYFIFCYPWTSTYTITPWIKACLDDTTGFLRVLTCSLLTGETGPLQSPQFCKLLPFNKPLSPSVLSLYIYVCRCILWALFLWVILL